MLDDVGNLLSALFGVFVGKKTKRSRLVWLMALSTVFEEDGGNVLAKVGPMIRRHIGTIQATSDKQNKP